EAADLTRALFRPASGAVLEGASEELRTTFAEVGPFREFLPLTEAGCANERPRDADAGGRDQGSPARSRRRGDAAAGVGGPWGARGAGPGGGAGGRGGGCAARARAPRRWPTMAAAGTLLAGAAAAALVVYAHRDRGPLHLADGRAVA